MGPVVDAVRPRLHRWRDQPGHEEAVAHARGRGLGVGEHHGARALDHRHQPPAVRHLGLPHRGAWASRATPARATQTTLKDSRSRRLAEFGINTPHQITLYALLLQHNQRPARLRPAAAQRPPGEGGPGHGLRLQQRPHDRPNIAFSAVGIEHKLTPDTSIRNQTQFNYVTTDARETAPQSIGRCRPRACSRPSRRAPSTVPAAAFSSLPLSSLWVRQQSHDRNDPRQVAVQPDRAQHHVRPPARSSTRCSRAWSWATTPTTTRPTTATAPAAARGAELRPAHRSGYAAGTRAASAPVVDPGQRPPSNAPLATGQPGQGRSARRPSRGYVNDTIELSTAVEAGGGVR